MKFEASKVNKVIQEFLSTYFDNVTRAGLVANAFSKESCISYTRVVCVLLLYKLLLHWSWIVSKV